MVALKRATNGNNERPQSDTRISSRLHLFTPFVEMVPSPPARAGGEGGMGGLAATTPGTPKTSPFGNDCKEAK